VGVDVTAISGAVVAGSEGGTRLLGVVSAPISMGERVLAGVPNIESTERLKAWRRVSQRMAELNASTRVPGSGRLSMRN
jgi:hypothetical protein